MVWNIIRRGLRKVGGKAPCPPRGRCRHDNGPSVRKRNWVDSDNSKSPPPEPTLDSGKYDRLHWNLLKEHNKYRASAGLPELTLNPACTDLAIRQAKFQASIESCTHARPQRGSFGSDIREYWPGGRMAGENVAMNSGRSGSAETTKQWIDSKGHRENIMKRGFRQVGFGRAMSASGRAYWTAIFIS